LKKLSCLSECLKTDLNGVLHKKQLARLIVHLASFVLFVD